MALGSDTAGILNLVMRQGSVQITIGLMVGLGLTFGLASAMGDALQSTLFGVTGKDPMTYVAVATLITLVSLTATFIPARRATKVNPNVALRA